MIKDLILYRGFSVPKDASNITKNTIISKGLSGNEGFWKFELDNLRDKLDILFNKPDLSTSDTRNSSSPFPVVCACGDRIGASYYAHRGDDSGKVPYVIKFAAPLSSIYVDGRDFLYTVIGYLGKKPELKEKQILILKKLFGKAIERYLIKAVSSEESTYRFAMCDLACQDENVIIDHYKNKLVIGGRYDTIFRSAFFVKVPISSEQIISVEVSKIISFKSDLTLHDFM